VDLWRVPGKCDEKGSWRSLLGVLFIFEFEFKFVAFSVAGRFCGTAMYTTRVSKGEVKGRPEMAEMPCAYCR
jgi:hypothetical protein